MGAFGFPETGGELAHLEEDNLVNSAEHQSVQPNLAIHVAEKKKELKSEPINEYHKQLGHPNLVMNRSTTKARDVSLMGTSEICKDCTLGKA